MTTLRAVMRPLRTELIGVAGITTLVLLAAGAIAARLLAFDIPTACFGAGSGEPGCLARQYDIAAYQSFGSSWAGPVAFFAAFLPSVAGIILGIALVAKELEQRTVGLAWSVDASRRHWLLLRTTPLVGIIVLLGILSTQVVAAMFTLGNPGEGFDAETSFSFIPYSGFSPMAVGISAFGVTAVIGAMLGRLLPAMLAAGALVLFGFLVIQQGNDFLMAGESLVAEGPFVGQGRQIDSMLRGPDGRVISWNDASSEGSYTTYFDPELGQLQPGVVELVRYVPIEIFPQVAARYALLHLVVGFMALTLTFAVVERRSP